MRFPSGAQRVAKLMDAGPDLLIAIIIAFIRWVMGVVVRTYEAYDTASYMYTTLLLKSDALRPSRCLSVASPLIRALPAPLIASGSSAVAASVAASAKPEKRISPSSTIIHLDEDGHDVDDEPSPCCSAGSSSSSSCRFLDCAEATSPRAEAGRPTAKLPERREVEEPCDPEAVALHADAEVQPAVEMQPAVST